MKIRELTISARAKMCLLSAGYEDIEDLENVTDGELLKIKNLNEKGVAEIRTAINTYFTDDDAENEFEDITIFQENGGVEVNVDFCGLEFDEFSEKLTISIWASSNSEDTYKIWMKDLYVNDVQYKAFKCIGSISDYDSDYMEMEIEDVDDISYEDIKKISFLIEIDDENDDELANSKVVTLFCNIKKESFFVESIEEYKKDEEIIDEDIDWSDIEEDEPISDPTELSIDDVELSVRSYNCLKRAGIKTIGELCDMTMEDMMKVRNLGRKSLEEILTMLKDKGLALKDSDDEDEITGDVNTNISIEELEFSVRTYNCLNRAGIRTLRDICKKTPEDMMKVRNLGRKSLEEVLAKLNEYGLSLAESDNRSTNQEIYARFKKIIREEGIEQAIEYLEEAVENGYTGDYSIIHGYYMVGYDGIGGEQWEKSFEWMTRFYNDYENDRLILDDDFEFNRATYEFNLGIFNLKFSDSTGDKEKGINLLKDCILHSTEYNDDTTTNLSKIAVSMLGITMDIYGSSISMGCDMKSAVTALQKDAELGNPVAKQIVAHVSRDGYDLNDVNQLLIELNDNENVYLLALCFKYGYVAPVNESEYEKLLTDVFGEGFDFAEYQDKHMDEADDAEEEFEDIRILDEVDCSVDFCGLEIDKTEETIEVKIWVYNKSDSQNNVWLKDLEINGIHVSNFEEIGEIDSYEGEFMEYQINSEEMPVPFERVRTLRFSVEIDDEDNSELFTSEMISMSINTELEIFSIKEELQNIESVEDENEDVLRKLDIQLKQLLDKFNA